MATGGSSQMRLMRRPDDCPACPSPSPLVTDAWPYSAHTDACCTVTGHTRPGQPSSARNPSTAARKSPLYRCIIDSRRFPPVCPPSRACSSVGSRARSTRRASRALRDSASAHLRMSPGGSTPSSSRSWPELPPLSNIVTTALTFSHGLLFNPPSRLGSPVPPPKHPTFSCRSRISKYCTGVAMSKSATILDRDLHDIFGARLQSVVQYGTRARHTPPAQAGGHHPDAPEPLAHTLAIVDTLSADDLRACSRRVPAWHDAGFATPLILPAHEFNRSLDAFPFEFG